MNSIHGFLYRRLGIFELNREYIRSRWVEISFRFGLALALINWSEGSRFSLHIHLGWPNIFIKLPVRSKSGNPDYGAQTWGLSLFESALHLNWGNHCKIVHLPWDWDWYRTSYLMKDGTWLHELRSDRPGVNKRSPFKTNHDHYQHIRELRDAGQWEETYPYRYVLKSGEVQDRLATVKVEEFERRRRWLRWTRLGSAIRQSIDVSFSDEVGERIGSWKGGTVGCGYDLKPGETPEQCLRRMERERTFR